MAKKKNFTDRQKENRSKRRNRKTIKPRGSKILQNLRLKNFQHSKPKTTYMKIIKQ